MVSNGQLEFDSQEGNTLRYRALQPEPTARGFAPPPRSQPSYTIDFGYYTTADTTSNSYLYGCGYALGYEEQCKHYWAWVHSWDGSQKAWFRPWLKRSNRVDFVRRRRSVTVWKQPGLRLRPHTPSPIPVAHRKQVNAFMRWRPG